MHACMYAYHYCVCMYVYSVEYMIAHTPDTWMYGCMDVWMYWWMDVCMHVSTEDVTTLRVPLYVESTTTHTTRAMLRRMYTSYCIYYYTTTRVCILCVSYSAWMHTESRRWMVSWVHGYTDTRMEGWRKGCIHHTIMQCMYTTTHYYTTTTTLHACMYVCIPLLRMYVCIQCRVYDSTYPGYMDVWMYGCMDVLMDGCMHACIHRGCYYTKSTSVCREYYYTYYTCYATEDVY